MIEHTYTVVDRDKDPDVTGLISVGPNGELILWTDGGSQYGRIWAAGEWFQVIRHD